jgi:large subunit ribosomal protein L32
MAQLKRKQSKERSRKRRGANRFIAPQFSKNADGSLFMMHHVDPSTGTYRGRQVIALEEQLRPSMDVSSRVIAINVMGADLGLSEIIRGVTNALGDREDWRGILVGDRDVIQRNHKDQKISIIRALKLFMPSK